MKRLLITFSCILLLVIFAQPMAVNAQEIMVSSQPLIIHEKAFARDIIKKNIRLKNKTESKINLFGKIHNISPDKGLEEFVVRTLDDKQRSLASWTSFQRSGIELEPGAEVDIPIEIKVNYNAVPGIYYAAIYFTKETHLPQDQELALLTQQQGTLVMLEVLANTKERAELDNFNSTKLVNFKGPVQFEGQVKNIGNVDLTLSRGLAIFDSRGERLTTIDFPPDTKITPKEKKDIKFEWTPEKFGRYKALLEVEYSSDQRKLQDTIYFYYIPRKTAVLWSIGTIGFLMMVLISRIIIHHRHNKSLDYQEKKSNETMSDIKPPPG